MINKIKEKIKKIFFLHKKEKKEKDSTPILTKEDDFDRFIKIFNRDNYDKKLNLFFSFPEIHDIYHEIMDTHDIIFTCVNEFRFCNNNNPNEFYDITDDRMSIYTIDINKYRFEIIGASILAKYIDYDTKKLKISYTISSEKFNNIYIFFKYIFNNKKLFKLEKSILDNFICRVYCDYNKARIEYNLK